MKILSFLLLLVITFRAFAHIEKSIFILIKEGDYSAVEKALKEGTDPNLKDERNDSLLIHALRFNQIKIKDLLCLQGAKDEACIRTYDRKQSETLNVLIKDNKATTENVLELLAKGADPSFLMSGGKTPLLNSITNNRKELVQILLEHGAFINQDYETTGPALRWSLRTKNLEIADLLLKYGANPALGKQWSMLDPNSSTYVIALRELQDESWLRRLIFETPKQEITSSFIWFACTVDLSEEEILKYYPYFISAGADINGKDSSSNSIIKCLSKRDISKITAAISLGADPTKVSDIFFERDIRLDIVQLLIEHGAVISIKDLKEALYWRQADRVAIYLKGLNPQETYQGQPGIWAPFIYGTSSVICMNFNSELFHALLRGGFNIDAPLNEAIDVGRWKIKPTLLGACSEFKEVRTVLLEAGANPNIFDATNSYAPMFTNDGFDAVEQFLNHGGDLNLINSQGESAAFYIMANQHDTFDEAYFNLFKKYGAKFDFVTKYGSTFLSTYISKTNSNKISPIIVSNIIDEFPAALEIKEAFPGYVPIKPIFRALEKEHPRLMQVLISKGADINAKNWKSTVLHEIANLKPSPAYLQIFEMFLQAGARTDLLDHMKMTVRDLAIKNQRNDLIDLLNRYRP